jgi:DNA-directed RNA polymerase beta subunit
MGGNIDDFIVLLQKYLENFSGISLAAFEHALRKNQCLDGKDPMETLSHICNKEISKIPHMIHLEILPHLNGGSRTIPNHHTDKLNFLAYLTTRLILFSKGLIPPTDRDCQRVSRVTSSSSLLAVLFRSLFITHARQCMFRLRKLISDTSEIDDKLVSTVYTHTRLSRKIISALATGCWSAIRRGISQSLGNTNHYHILSQLRLVASGALNSDGKHVLPRIIHGTSYGYECAAETPEGTKCGLLRGLALLTRLSYRVPANHVEFILRKHLGHLLQEEMSSRAFIIFGPSQTILGYCTNIQSWQQAFEHLKKNSCLDIYVSSYMNFDRNEWYCFAEDGRLMRPLIVLANAYKVHGVLNKYQHLPTEFLKSILLHEGCIEYVDALRESNLSISLHPSPPPNSTHMELNDITFLGILAATAPLFRHNQGPRLVYWTNMIKQVIPSTTTVDPTSTFSNTMWYPQRPLVITQTQKDLNFHCNEMGVNVIIAFLPIEWTQEDALVINKAALERGMFSTTLTRAYSSSAHSNSKHERFERPHENTLHTRATDYSTIQSNGIPAIGSFLPPNSIVIGKTVDQKVYDNSIVSQKGKKRKYSRMSRDSSVSIRRNEKGTVTSVSKTTYNNDTSLKVNVSDYTSPVVGDKFSSRHAQKGTIGHICPPQDMPFSIVTGLSPDICMSPLGLTSRMTMGVLLEAILGKVVCLTSDLDLGVDRQSLQESYETNIQTFQNILQEHGFHHSGKEKYRDGTTGKFLTAHVMTGCMTYVKLNHLVTKKGQARSTGPIQILNRQPTEGIARNGGLRLGSMEMECLTAHGVSEILYERTSTTSDAYHTTFCSICGHISESNLSIQYLYCRVCQTGEHIRKISLSYSTKLMIQELAATGIKLLLSENAPPIL